MFLSRAFYRYQRGACRALALNVLSVQMASNYRISSRVCPLPARWARSHQNLGHAGSEITGTLSPVAAYGPGWCGSADRENAIANHMSRYAANQFSSDFVNA